MKRFLSLLTAIVLVLSMLPVMSLAAQERIVYIDPAAGVDTNSGLTEQAPVKTVSAAYAALSGAETGKIVFLSTLSLSALTNFPSCSIPVTLTSKTGAEGISSSYNIYFKGPTTLENITLTSKATNGYTVLAGGGYPFTIGNSVTTTKTGEYYFSVCGGSNSSDCNGVDLTMRSGSWQNVYIGSHGLRTVNGDCVADLSGVTLSGSLSVGYKANVTGNVTVSVTNSTIASVYACATQTTGSVGGNISVTLGEGAQVTNYTIESNTMSVVAGTNTLTLDGGQVTNIKKSSENASSGATSVVMRSGRVDTCKDAADNVSLNIPADKTLTIGGQVTANTLQCAGTLCFTGNSELKASSVTGTINCTVEGDVLANHLYLDAPADSQIVFDPETGIIENNGQWTVDGEPADENFVGLVLKAEPGITVTLYNGVKEEGRTKVTPTKTVTGEYNYYYYEISSGYYHYIATGTGRYKIQKNIYMSSAEAAGKTVLDVTPPLLSGEGWEQKTNVKLYTDEVLTTIRKDDPTQWPDYADVFTTPYFTEERTEYQMTTQDQMEAFIDGLDDENDNLYVYNAGTSTTYGFAIDAIVVTKTDLSGAKTMEEAAALVGQDKPTIFYRAHMHGSEPASGEAALAILQRLDGALGEQVLDQINLVIIPRNSPDAAYKYERYILGDVELNRDYMALEYSETEAFLQVFNLFEPELVLDGHEFLSPTMGSYIEYDDAQLGLGFSKENSKEFEEAYRPMIAEVQQNLTDNGLYYRYYTNVVATDASASGSRSYTSMQGTMFVLVESHGIGTGTEGYHRRVVSHVVSMQTMIEYVAKNAQAIQSTVDAERQRIIALGATYEESDQIVLETTKVEDESYSHPAIHIYQSGKIVNETIVPSVRDVVRSRIAPTAYVIPAGNSYIGQILELMDKQNIQYTFIPVGSKVLLQQYSGTVTDSGVADVALSEEMEVSFAYGAYVFCKNQVKGKILSAYMEPDVKQSIKHSLAYRGFVPNTDGQFPIYRYIHDLNEEGFIDYEDISYPSKLEEDLEELSLSCNWSLDLNGYDILNLETNGYTLTVWDSATDDYDVSDGIYGSVPADADVQIPEGYISVTVDGRTSFHKYEIKLTELVVNTKKIGLTYKAQFLGDEVIKDGIREFGVAVRAFHAPDENSIILDTAGLTHMALKPAAWQNRKSVKSVYVVDIMDATIAAATNDTRAEVVIYGVGYIILKDGTMLFGNTAGESLKSAVQYIDDLWTTDVLSDSDRNTMAGFCKTWEFVMANWDGIDRIKAAAGIEVPSIPVS